MRGIFGKRQIDDEEYQRNDGVPNATANKPLFDFCKSLHKSLLNSRCFYYTTVLHRFCKKTKMFTNFFEKEEFVRKTTVRLKRGFSSTLIFENVP